MPVTGRHTGRETEPDRMRARLNDGFGEPSAFETREDIEVRPGERPVSYVKPLVKITIHWP
jgi:hypothetical protein